MQHLRISFCGPTVGTTSNKGIIMEKELAAGKIGEKGSYKLEFKAGKLVGAVMVDTSVVDVELLVKLDGEPVVLAVFDKIAARSPFGGPIAKIANQMR